MTTENRKTTINSYYFRDRLLNEKRKQTTLDFLYSGGGVGAGSSSSSGKEGRGGGGHVDIFINRDGEQVLRMPNNDPSIVQQLMNDGWSYDKYREVYYRPMIYTTPSLLYTAYVTRFISFFSMLSCIVSFIYHIITSNMFS